ncbi:HupE/UreJ family protein [Roseateles chitosanitabidus]|uniref:HupE/UreJ family protein n=1 Tax=Roseateles chitosanitabidus TaxID=65048 RepID=UPI000A7DE243|nr:HupE/UreJ family protein [Roseateles chitosanitabidus]
MSAARDDGIERRAPASRPPATGFSFGLKGALRLVLAGLMAMAALMALLPRAAHAHEMSMAEMQVRETAPGEFIWQWTASEKRAADEVLTPQWPEGCKAEGLNLHCGKEGLRGSFAMEGVGKQYSAALVKVFWLDGQSRVYTLTAGQPSVQLFGSAEDQRGWGEIARAYTVLGVEHILAGVDHLMFVIGLLFLVGFRRRLLWTITAFTAAHSLTLGMSALGWLALRPPPVEATIALSIVLVAGEALHQRQTLARRWPALVAFLFGLVHGLGFAGALREIGLPQQHLMVALLSFNVGVEIGQLLTVGLCWGLWWVARRWPAAARLRTGLLYAIGAAAAYWSWARVAAILA